MNKLYHYYYHYC